MKYCLIYKNEKFGLTKGSHFMIDNNLMRICLLSFDNFLKFKKMIKMKYDKAKVDYLYIHSMQSLSIFREGDPIRPCNYKLFKCKIERSVGYWLDVECSFCQCFVEEAYIL